jgi:hypothetical protein
VGNIMYNLAGHEDAPPDGDATALAALPIPASEIGLPYLAELNEKYERFRTDMMDAKKHGDATRAYFLSTQSSPALFTPSITSFLCTDVARDVFISGGQEFHSTVLKNPGSRFPDQSGVWTNQACLEEARRFFTYADIEGFRGSPHKL